MKLRYIIRPKNHHPSYLDDTRQWQVIMPLLIIISVTKTLLFFKCAVCLWQTISHPLFFCDFIARRQYRCQRHSIYNCADYGTATDGLHRGESCATRWIQWAAVNRIYPFRPWWYATEYSSTHEIATYVTNTDVPSPGSVQHLEWPTPKPPSHGKPRSEANLSATSTRWLPAVHTSNWLSWE